MVNLVPRLGLNPGIPYLPGFQRQVKEDLMEKELKDMCSSSIPEDLLSQGAVPVPSKLHDSVRRSRHAHDSHVSAQFMG